MNAKKLPADLTARDFLKMLAVVLMIIDHIGYHFYPEMMWFRVLGRLSAPIWLFLVGYANTEEKPLYLWAAAVLVQLSAVISGQYLLPLNILFTILLMRHMRRAFVLSATASPESLRGVFLILIFSTLPSAILFEYGAIAMNFVLIGFFVHHREKIYEVIAPRYIILFTVLTFFVFFLMEGLSLPTLDAAQALALLLGFVWLGGILWTFKSATFPRLTKALPFPLVWLIQIFGRHTLEIYVFHLILFRGICMWLYPDQYGFMDWHWVPGSLVRAFF